VAPDYPATYYLLADVLLKQQKLSEAVPHFRKAIEMSPGDVEARIGLGQALAGLDRLPEAARELEQAARLAPDEPRVHFQLSRVYFRLGDERRAEQEAELSAKLRPAVVPLLTEVPSALRSAGPK
jgi:Flp pilus assembly protein TadD